MNTKVIFDYGSLQENRYYVTGYQANHFYFLAGLMECHPGWVVDEADQADVVVIVTDALYDELPAEYRGFRRTYLVHPRSVTKMAFEESQLIQTTDWIILRNLERMFLKDHPLHQQREQWRQAVDEKLLELKLR